MLTQASVGPPTTRPAGRRATGVVLLLALVGAVALLRATVAFPVRVDSASMMPTFREGDVVLVSHTRPDLEDLSRGDLVTFRSAEDGKRVLKRVVGLPGDSLVIKDSLLHVNGRIVAEPYVDHDLIDGYYSRTFTVPEGRVFVLGDNRGNSIDSRDYGSVGADELRGRVLSRVWPLTR
jgi:signal peptidase I